MRVIAGTARRLPLKTLEGLETRPTTDRIKETLFNIIQNDVNGCRFLDLLDDSGQQAFDFIFMDPPYGKGLEREALVFLSHSRLVDEFTVIIAEASLIEDFSYLENTIFSVEREKKYKTNKHVFIAMKEL